MKEEIKNNSNQSAVVMLMLALVVAALIFGAYLVWKNQNKEEVRTAEKQNLIPDQSGPGDANGIVKTDVDQKQLPPNFPKDLPLEKDRVITQNYVANVGAEQLQATHVYTSKKTLDENFTIFQNYFVQKGWQIATSSKIDNLQTITGRKDGSEINVVISQNPQSKVNSVDLTLTSIKK